jgi:hypothetical protein
MNIYHAPYCTYLTVIIYSDLPFMYIGSGKTKDVLSGKYKGSVSSKQYKAIFNQLKQEQSHLVHSEVINQFETRQEAMDEEIKLHAMYDVAKCPVFMNKARATATGFTCYERSDETKAKIGAANKGRTLSPASKANISKGKKGKPLSEETKAKISAANKIANKGKTHSEETKAKISASLKSKALSPSN